MGWLRAAIARREQLLAQAGALDVRGAQHISQVVEDRLVRARDGVAPGSGALLEGNGFGDDLLLLRRAGIPRSSLVEGGMPGPPQPQPGDDHLHDGHKADIDRESPHLDDEVGSGRDHGHRKDPKSDPRQTPRARGDEHREEDQRVGAHDERVHTRARRGQAHRHHEHDGTQGHPGTPGASPPHDTCRRKRASNCHRGRRSRVRRGEDKDEHDNGNNGCTAPGDGQ